MEQANPFTQYLDEFESRIINAIEKKFNHLLQKPARARIPSTEFCKRKNISRHTLYRWRDRKIIETETEGRTLYVIVDSDTVPPEKYQREPVTA